MPFFNSSIEFCDTVAMIVQCTDNSYMFIQEVLSSEFWIPTLKIEPGLTALRQISNEALEIFGSEITTDGLLRTYRFWVPSLSNCIYHFIFTLKINEEQKYRSKQTKGKYRGKIVWVLESELHRKFSTNNSRSPELFETIMSWKNNTKIGIPEIFVSDGIDYSGNFMEMGENIIISSTNNSREQLVLSATLSRQIQCSIYQEFLLLCLPSFFMSFNNFCKFFSSVGWTKNELIDLFRAADLQSRNGISFREFLYLIAAVEPSVDSISGKVGDIRNKYIFRFYDKDNDGILQKEEFKLVFIAIRKSLKQSIEPDAVDKDYTECLRSFGLSGGTPISVPIFLRACQENRIKNISVIFKSALPIVSYLREASERDIKQNQTTSKKNKGKTSLTYDSSLESYLKSTDNPIFYEVASHSIKINTCGTMNIDNLKNLEAAVSPSSIGRPTFDEIRKKISIDQFNQDSISNELIKTLRYMNLMNKQTKGLRKNTSASQTQFVTWGNVDIGLFAKRLICVCKLAAELFKNEPRLLQVSSPVYILGDIHGNFVDLMNFESVLWHVGPVLCPSNILFLGDYVDRGLSSVEVITYLFSYKIQNPNKFKMIRGNHEIREIQKMFTFFTECKNKFGERLGAEVWNAINNAFDNLPIAAVVDKNLFCCHGGIPPPWICPVVSAINEIPVPLNLPSEQSALAWEIMWNDPIKSRFATEQVELELSSNEGFAVNKRRGTAHIFNADALDKFLKSNGLTHLIRAHEVAPAGFCVMQRAKLINVFSSSKYCGSSNDAACLMVDQGRVRIIRIESE